MTKEGAIKWKNEIKAFQEGKQIQRKTRGVWFDEKSPRFEVDVEYRVKPESTKRLPTIEEVEQWFLENRVFRFKKTGALTRLKNVDCRKEEEKQIFDINIWITIEEFCEKYTHYDGSELYITE